MYISVRRTISGEVDVRVENIIDINDKGEENVWIRSIGGLSLAMSETAAKKLANDILLGIEARERGEKCI